MVRVDIRLRSIVRPSNWNPSVSSLQQWHGFPLRLEKRWDSRTPPVVSSNNRTIQEGSGRPRG